MKCLLISFVFHLSLTSVFGQSSTSSYTTAQTTLAPESTTTAVQYGSCPGDWIDADILGCYKFLDGKVNHTWVEAQYECEQIGGYLAEPTNHRLSSFLHSLANWDEDVSGIKYWFLGLTDLGVEGGWNWIHSKSMLSDENWGQNKPDTKPGNKADCTVMVLKSDKYWWEDWDCMLAEIHHAPVAPVCQRDTDAFVTTVIPETTPNNEGCESDWTEFDGSCYKYISGSSYWPTAVGKCAEYESHPAIIHSKEEEDFLRELSTGVNFWLGGTYLDRAIWMDGSAFDYGSWYNPQNNQCMFHYYSYGKFDTDGCTSHSLPVICEK